MTAATPQILSNGLAWAFGNRSIVGMGMIAYAIVT